MLLPWKRQAHKHRSGSWTDETNCGTVCPKLPPHCERAQPPTPVPVLVYRYWGEAVFRACVESGTDYLDVCGEPGKSCQGLMRKGAARAAAWGEGCLCSTPQD